MSGEPNEDSLRVPRLLLTHPAFTVRAAWVITSVVLATRVKA